jgi:hypothetical protein
MARYATFYRLSMASILVTLVGCGANVVVGTDQHTTTSSDSGIDVNNQGGAGGAAGAGTAGTGGSAAGSGGNAGTGGSPAGSGGSAAGSGGNAGVGGSAAGAGGNAGVGGGAAGSGGSAGSGGCMGGSCPPIACDAGTDPSKVFVSKDPSTCASLPFSCPGATFNDSCGCGCVCDYNDPKRSYVGRAGQCGNTFGCDPPWYRFFDTCGCGCEKRPCEPPTGTACCSNNVIVDGFCTAQGDAGDAPFRCPEGFPLRSIQQCGLPEDAGVCTCEEGGITAYDKLSLACFCANNPCPSYEAATTTCLINDHRTIETHAACNLVEVVSLWGADENRYVYDATTHGLVGILRKTDTNSLQCAAIRTSAVTAGSFPASDCALSQRVTVCGDGGL